MKIIISTGPSLLILLFFASLLAASSVARADDTPSTPVNSRAAAPSDGLAGTAVSPADLGGPQGSVAKKLPPPENVQPVSLLDQGGVIEQTVAAKTIKTWQTLLGRKDLPSDQAAQLRIWLGEYYLSHDAQPDEACEQFQLAEGLVPPTSNAYGLSKFDSAIALYEAGAYSDSQDAFR